MGKVCASVIVSIGLLLGGIVLLENWYGPDALDGKQETSSISLADHLTQHWDKDKKNMMEEYAVLYMIILASIGSILVLITWYHHAQADTSDSDETAVRQETAVWSSRCDCYVSPQDSSGVKSYTITVMGEISGKHCARLEMTLHSDKDLSQDILIGLEDAILEILNKTEDINSPQRLLDIVHMAALDYLQEHNLIDDNSSKGRSW